MSTFETKNPDFERIVRDSFSRQGFMGTIGAEMVSVAPGRLTAQPSPLTPRTPGGQPAAIAGYDPVYKLR